MMFCCIIRLLFIDLTILCFYHQQLQNRALMPPLTGRHWVCHPRHTWEKTTCYASVNTALCLSWHAECVSSSSARCQSVVHPIISESAMTSVTVTTPCLSVCDPADPRQASTSINCSVWASQRPNRRSRCARVSHRFSDAATVVNDLRKGPKSVFCDQNQRLAKKKSISRQSDITAQLPATIVRASKKRMCSTRFELARANPPRP